MISVLLLLSVFTLTLGVRCKVPISKVAPSTFFLLKLRAVIEKVQVEQNRKFFNLTVDVKNYEDDTYGLNYTLYLLKDCEKIRVS